MTFLKVFQWGRCELMHMKELECLAYDNHLANVRLEVTVNNL